MILYSCAVFSCEINWKNPDFLSNPLIISRALKTNQHLHSFIEKTMTDMMRQNISYELINLILAQRIFESDRAIPTINASLIQDIMDGNLSELNEKQITTLQKSHESKTVNKVIEDAKKELSENNTKHKNEIIKNSRLLILDKIVSKIRPMFTTTEEEKISENRVHFYPTHPGFYSYILAGQIFILETDAVLPESFIESQTLFYQLNLLFQNIATVKNDKAKLTEVFSQPDRFSLAPISAITKPAYGEDKLSESKSPAVEVPLSTSIKTPAPLTLFPAPGVTSTTTIEKLVLTTPTVSV